MRMTILGKSSLHENIIILRAQLTVLLMVAVTACCWTMMKCAQSFGVLMTRSLSDYFLRNAGIDTNYHCTKSMILSYCVEEYHATLFHTQSPQNQYSRSPHLNKSLITSSRSPHSPWVHASTCDLSIKHTKPVKAPVYTCALQDIGNEECVKMVTEHEAHADALTSIENNS